MKKLFLVLIIITFFCGCSNVNELSEKDSKAAVGYMANTVRKYNTNTDMKLQKIKSLDENDKDFEIEQEDNDKKNNSETTDTPISETTAIPETKKEISLTEAFGEKNVEFVIDSTKKIDSYSEKDYLLVEPKEGYEILIVRFKLKNTSEKNIKLNLFSKNIDYSLKFNEYSFLPLMTVVENDIMFLEAELKPNEPKYAVLFFQIEKGMNYDDVKLEIVSEKGSCIEQIGVDKK